MMQQLDHRTAPERSLLQTDSLALKDVVAGELGYAREWTCCLDQQCELVTP
jgi:hypothetical protein